MSGWVAGAMVVSAIGSAYMSNKASKDASAAQIAGAEAGSAATQEATRLSIAEQRRQFDQSMAILNPYVMAGYEALGYDPIGVEQIDHYENQLKGVYGGIAADMETEVSPMFEDHSRPGTPPVPFDEFNRPSGDPGFEYTGQLAGGTGLRVKGGPVGASAPLGIADYEGGGRSLPPGPVGSAPAGAPLPPGIADYEGGGRPSHEGYSEDELTRLRADGVLPGGLMPGPQARPITPMVGAFNPKRGLGLYRSAGETGLPILGEYAEAGRSALQSQRAIAGELGPEAQQAAIQGIQAGPEMGALIQQGENALLQNASATGGMRGGNTSAALAQFRPQILSQLLNKQYNRLGGLSTQGGNIAQYLTGAGQAATGQVASMGQAAAAGQAAAGQQSSQNISNLISSQGATQANLFGQIGSANAGRSLARGQSNQDLIGDLTKAYGYYRKEI